MAGVTVDVTTRVILDVILLALSPLPSLIFKVAVSPFNRGFFCNDESISHPYKEDNVPLWIVIMVGMVTPALLMIPIEILRYRRHIQRKTVEYKKTFLLCKKAVHPYLVNIYKAVGPFLFAIAVCQVTTDIMKYSIGRLRPHFLDVCQPDWSQVNCKDSYGNSRYIEDNVCISTKHMKEARLSHPSGHASQSMLCAVYFAIYLQVRLTWSGSRLLRHFTQAILIYGAIYVCVSRICDYHHHWSDVLVGGLLGILIACLVAYFVSDLFPRPTGKALKTYISQMNQFHENKNQLQSNGRDSGADEYSMNNKIGNE